MKKLLIHNFQLHSKLLVEFDPQITAIVGPSDVGKSAIIRALRWLMLNKPRGDSFIKQGEKTTSTKLRIGGHTIERIRNGNENIYRLDEKEYRAFGNGVPSEIANLLSVDETNFQGQHDSPFWFNLTAGELAHELNQVVDLGIIDKVSSSIASKLRKAKVELEVCEGRLEKAKNDRESLKFIKTVDQQLRELEKQQEKVEEANDRRAKLGDLLTKASNHQTTHKRLSEGLLGALEAMSRAQRARELCGRLDNLEEFLKAIRKTREIVLLIGKLDLSEIDDSYAKMMEGKKRLHSLVQLAIGIKQSQKTSDEGYNRVEKTKQELREKTKGLCPICGSKLKEM